MLLKIKQKNEIRTKMRKIWVKKRKRAINYFTQNLCKNNVYSGKAVEGERILKMVLKNKMKV